MKKTPNNITKNNSELLEKHMTELKKTGGFNVLELPIFKTLKENASLERP